MAAHWAQDWETNEVAGVSASLRLSLKETELTSWGNELWDIIGHECWFQLMSQALAASGAMEEGMLMLRMLLEGEGEMWLISNVCTDLEVIARAMVPYVFEKTGVNPLFFSHWPKRTESIGSWAGRDTVAVRKGSQAEEWEVIKVGFSSSELSGEFYRLAWAIMNPLIGLPSMSSSLLPSPLQLNSWVAERAP